MQYTIVLIQLLLAGLGTFILFFLKSLKEDLKSNIKDVRSDIKDIRDDLKSINSKLDNMRDRISRVEGQEDMSRSVILELWKNGPTKQS